MNNEWNALFAQMSEASEQAVATATRLQQIAARAQSQLARSQFDALQTVFEAGTEQLKLVGANQDPAAIVEGQIQMASEVGEKLVVNAQHSLEVQSQARDEIVSLFEDGVKRIQDATTTALEMSPPAAVAPARKAPRSRRKAA